MTPKTLTDTSQVQTRTGTGFQHVDLGFITSMSIESRSTHKNYQLKKKVHAYQGILLGLLGCRKRVTK